MSSRLWVQQTVRMVHVWSSIWLRSSDATNEVPLRDELQRAHRATAALPIPPGPQCEPRYAPCTEIASLIRGGRSSSAPSPLLCRLAGDAGSGRTALVGTSDLALLRSRCVVPRAPGQVATCIKITPRVAVPTRWRLPGKSGDTSAE
jgi:hypothetical protein